jgi:tartrate-resistant acid phosphatase type 5
MLSRRGFLRQSFAFSAVAGLGSLPSFARKPDTSAAQLLMIGDWGYEDFTAQSRVAGAMQQYVRGHGLTTDALLMLGDNWYGPLPDGVASTRWKTQFEDMYPKSVFNCPRMRLPATMIISECLRARLPRNWSTRARVGRDGRCHHSGTGLTFQCESH